MNSSLQLRLFSKLIFLFFVLIFNINTIAVANDKADTSSVVEDEFKEWNEDSEDEFSEWNENTTSNDSLSSCASTCKSTTGCNSSCTSAQAEDNTGLYWIYWILGFTILAGILSRIPFARNFRNLFLLSSLLILGFYQGACPCPILHFENTILFFTGMDIPWQNMIYFLALIPVTYIFGKVWCGWICHLGALQEFLYLPARFNFLKSAKSQTFLKILRYILIAVLIIQLVIQQEVFWCKIDPFMLAFNLQLPYDNEILGGILLGLILLTSLFTFRPLCRAACPIGAYLIGING